MIADSDAGKALVLAAEVGNDANAAVEIAV